MSRSRRKERRSSNRVAPLRQQPSSPRHRLRPPLRPQAPACYPSARKTSPRANWRKATSRAPTTASTAYYEATTRRRISPPPRTRKRPAMGHPSDERQRGGLAATTPISTPTHTNNDEHGRQDLRKNILICRYF